MYQPVELTGDSCATPSHVWASLGGSQLFLGSSRAVGTSAGPCSRGPSHWDDTRTWGERKQETNEDRSPERLHSNT